jgi:type VI secretion system secreted protein Hcp
VTEPAAPIDTIIYRFSSETAMAVDMFMKITGIDGESIDKTHKGEIEVLAWAWGASQTGTLHTATGGGAGKANFQDISFTKYIDKGSPVLLTKLATGAHLNQATLVVRKAGGSPLEYLKLSMHGVLVTSIAAGGSGGEDRLTENVTLNFAKFDYEYVQQQPDGTGGGPVIASYDIGRNSGA